jgi:hypothetical protein
LSSDKLWPPRGDHARPRHPAHDADVAPGFLGAPLSACSDSSEGGFQDDSGLDVDGPADGHLDHEAPLPPVPPLPPRPDSDGSDHGPRAVRGSAWGPWAIAPVFRAGVQVAWGATCAQHHNSRLDRTVCKKQMVQGTMSDQECQIRLKMWLLAGTRIEFERAPTEALPTPSRTLHLQIRPTTDFPALATNSELERQLVAFMHPTG